MLAFEMGLGKTLCVIAAHALEQHTVPEAQEETELTEEQLEQEYVEVLVGKRFPEEPDREKLKTAKMYRGFKQIDDGRGTIVPDGSVRSGGAMRPFWRGHACTRHHALTIASCCATLGAPRHAVPGARMV